MILLQLWFADPPRSPQNLALKGFTGKILQTKELCGRLFRSCSTISVNSGILFHHDGFIFSVKVVRHKIAILAVENWRSWDFWALHIELDVLWGSKDS